MAIPAFGRNKADKSDKADKAGRHRTDFADQDTDPEAPDEEMDSYLAALAPDADADVETTGSGRRFGGSQVYQLRLSLMANEQLRELAARNDTSPLSLATEWVMQRLEWEHQQLVRD